MSEGILDATKFIAQASEKLMLVCRSPNSISIVTDAF